MDCVNTTLHVRMQRWKFLIQFARLWKTFCVFLTHSNLNSIHDVVLGVYSAGWPVGIGAVSKRE